MRVDLVFLAPAGKAYPSWTHGEVRAMPPHIPNAIIALDVLIRQSSAEFTLIWNYAYGDPDENTIEKLTHKSIDVWHAGLRLGLQGKPDLLQYIYPTWMYNYDVNPEIESTSFRLSFDACLFRNQTWIQAGAADGGFSTMDMIGLDLGYRWLKSGALIRYQPDLIKKSIQIQRSVIPLNDEFRFVRKNFPSKWYWWTFLRHFPTQGMETIKAFRSSRHTARQPQVEHGFNPRPRTEPTASASVSVLIPTLHRYPYLTNELEQLRRQTLKPLEVLITDQTNTESRQDDFVKTFADLNVRYFPQDTKGQCVAWNKLLEEAKGDYVLFLGDDADGISPEFIAQLVSDIQYYNADMVASHVVEVGLEDKKDVGKNIKMADGLPICLIRRELLLRTGFMDMVFNRDIRADHDLAMRCHQQGALLIYDYGCRILHHRAPSGGLREHKARVHSWAKSKNNLTLILLPTYSEVYLIKKYYTKKQVKEELAMRILSLFFVNGGRLKKCLRVVYMILQYPAVKYQHRKRIKQAEKNLNVNNSQ